MIRTATSYDIPALKRIWDESFHDSLSYIDFIFDKLASPKDAIVYEDAGRVVSMLLMIDTRFVYREESAKAVYILGAATSAHSRNRGIMTYLLDFAENTARQKDVKLCVLVPGEPYLYNYYKKRGYSADFNARLIKLKPGMLGQAGDPDVPVVIDRVSSDFIYAARIKALGETPHIQWDAEKMKTVMEDSFAYGDHIAAYAGSRGEAYAFYSLKGKKLFIKECLGNSPDAQLLLIKELVETNRVKSAQIVLPLGWPLFEFEGEVIPCGMAKPLNIKSYLRDLEPYMNLMFD